ncbi:hypothetical protein COV24_02025 [candidate division WWE3 bacterium CG10_big_fil_rev_8_21_14_0_10_32_10]|uniref:Glycosyl transferase family 1 domain-containing protein n=1 Tax=candidate division WWE3 bacterium CG10_big_fil_rev_8_21_14_0_10_32_10 TaxID=1975090 RepID=A0A2H0RAU6_UNCKA|nr:MAG: hypothetical protein COV24_02025 [candidate division WWE3 bacterium CG10_big_fil_rev_8_21_14_0_10_32_10]
METNNKNTKILFQSRLDLFDIKGGDTVQILETQKHLQKMGYIVDINLSINPDVSDYDIVHVFNLDWVCESFLQIKNAKKQHKPVVLSPIHHSLKEFERYEKEYRFGLAKIGNILLPYQPWRDVARNITKGFFYLPKLKPALIQLFYGIRRQQRESIEMADHIIVQTNIEADDLRKSYKARKFKWSKVVNGVDIKKFEKVNSLVALKIVRKNKYIFCAGRIEPRKNQLSLIKAFKELETTDPSFKNMCLVFSGSYNKHHPTYYKIFKKELNNKNIIYTGFINQEILAGLYSKCSIFACPSWFETTGLVYLEAVVSGSRSLVASGKRAKEYLEKNAVYCDPGSIESIKNSLVKALSGTVKSDFTQKVKKEYTWENCAFQTSQVYIKVLHNL